MEKKIVNSKYHDADLYAVVATIRKEVENSSHGELCDKMNDYLGKYIVDMTTSVYNYYCAKNNGFYLETARENGAIIVDDCACLPETQREIDNTVVFASINDALEQISKE